MTRSLRPSWPGEKVTLNAEDMKLFTQRIREACWFLLQDGSIVKETPHMRPSNPHKLQRFKLSNRFRLPDA